MCTKPFSLTKNEGKLFLVPKSSGPLLGRLPLNKATHNSNKKKGNLVTANTKLKENLEIMEKESAGQRKIMAKRNLEKLVIRVLLIESVSSSPKFT